MVSDLRIFKRVVTRLFTREGDVNSRVRDVPSAFLVHVAAMDDTTLEKYLKKYDSSLSLDSVKSEFTNLSSYVLSLASLGRSTTRIRKKRFRKV